MTNIIRKIPKLFHHLAGRGCGAADFESVYSRSRRDAWHYTENPFEKTRFDLVVEALAGMVVGKALEVGCAEGHLTRRLAGLAHQLTACDIVDAALERARDHCRELPNVQFLKIDVRTHWPDEVFDLVIYSDVLYYFSKPEIKRVIHDSAEHVGDGGHLLFANEWHNHYRWKTPPAFIMEQLAASPFWRLVSQRQHQETGDGRSVTIGLFRRLPHTAQTDGRSSFSERSVRLLNG
jgi:2-polyprenyl-3-methyl-5-hydroxy-6-metoxy-1,4-benzoquinol methylase